LRNIDELIDAVEYAQESGENWWDVFNSIKDAEKVLKGAAKEDPDEYQIAQLSDMLDEDIFESSPINAFRNCLKQLRKQIKEA